MQSEQCNRVLTPLDNVLGVALAGLQTWLVHGSLSPYDADQNLRVLQSRVGHGPVLAASAQIHLSYLQQIVAPFGLSPEYVDRGASFTEPATLLASAGLLSLALYGVWGGATRRRPLLALAVLGSFALAVPTSNLAGMPNMRADRFMYLPSLPACSWWL